MADAGPNALALAGVQPNVDLAGPMKSIAEIQMAQAHSVLYGAQAKFQIARQNALAQAAQLRAKGDPRWMDPIAAVDPEAAKHMQEFDWTQQEHTASQAAGAQENAGNTEAAARTVAGFPAVRDTLSKAFQAQTTAQQTVFKTQSEVIGSTSTAFLDAYRKFQNGGMSKDDLRKVWNEQTSLALKHHAINPMEYNSMYDMPDIGAAVRKARQGFMYSVAAKDVYSQGEGARTKAEAELPSKVALEEAVGKQHRLTEQAKPIIANPNDVITTGNRLQDKTPPGQEATNIEDTPGREIGQGNMGQVGADLPQAIIPKRALGTNDPRFMVQGMDEQTRATAKSAADHYEKEVKGPGMNALMQRSELNTMENLLASGQVQTNVAAEYKERMAGWIYAIYGGGQDPAKSAEAVEAAKRWTGIDVSSQPVFNKASTRMGLQYARATEGAREAVAAIRIALGANPQATTPREANLKIIRLMKAADQYSLDRMGYNDRYAQQNNHYVGADESFVRQRTPEMYISRVEPFHLPTGAGGRTDKARLQPDVVYQFIPPGQKNVTYGVWNGTKFREFPMGGG